jgi:SAM-dependent methyltransferase
MAKNEKKESRASLNENEVHVEIANLKAWNYWGHLWSQNIGKASTDRSVLLAVKTRAITYRRVYEKITESIGSFKGKIVLDVGCGTSEYHNWLSNDSESYVGVDLSVEMLKLCRKEMSRSVDLVSADAMHLPFKEGAFSTSLTFQALHHFPSWERALLEMVRTSDQVAVYEPNGDSFLHRLMHILRQTLRVEERFRQSDVEYDLVEFNASGFSELILRGFLSKKGLIINSFMFSLVPVSVLAKISSISPSLMNLVHLLEDFASKAPIIRRQLGDVLITARKS